MKKTLFSLLVINFTINLYATSLRDVVVKTINTNHGIVAEHLNQDAYRKYIDEEEGDYLPTLDFNAYMENSKTHDEPKSTTSTNEGWTKKNGWNSELKLQHVLYDGGLTPSEVREYTHKYLGNRYRSMYKIESIVKDAINTYTDLVKQQELMALSKNNIKIHEDYLKIAKDKEEISGEILESYEVASKHHSILDKYLEYENNWKKNKSKYKKLVGEKIKGNICRPIIHENLIPKSLKEAIEIGIRNNSKIAEQLEKINEQREVLFQTGTTYKPKVTFELSATWDKDLELDENGREDIYASRVYVSWNLFNGGKDHIASQREYIFLQEEKKKLDDTTEEVIDEIKEAYNTYFNLKKRIKNINQLVQQNANIIKIFRRQLDDGTRTFLDILNAESELYRSQRDRLDEEYSLYDAYYDFLQSISMLSDSILADSNQQCKKYKYVNEFEYKESTSEKETMDELKKSLNLLDEDKKDNKSPDELLIDDLNTYNIEKEKSNRLNSIYTNSLKKKK